MTGLRAHSANPKSPGKSPSHLFHGATQGRPLPAILGFLLWTCSAAPAALSPTAADGARLFADLGCSRCHADLSVPPTDLRRQIPDLGGAGLRYQPGYLFRFLQDPSPVRQHLSHARMPSFHLTPREALALTRFLQTQTNSTSPSPPFPKDLVNLDHSTPVSRTEFEAELARGLICLTCHTLDGVGGQKAVELNRVGHRLNPDWIRDYLVAPDVFGVATNLMPAQFYSRSADRGSFRPLHPRAPEQIRIVSGYLSALNPVERRLQDQALLAASNAHPDVDAVLGQQLFTALNCAACHRHPTIQPRTNAPPLVSIGTRVRANWLPNYLENPAAVRPSGVVPGDGARMPHFQLTPPEAAALAVFLLGQTRSATELVPFTPRTLSAFAKRKARTLLEEKLSCLGCHRFGAQGGRIGPDLTAAGSRLQPAFIYNIILDPRRLAPHSVMPRIPMPPATLELIASFLAQSAEPAKPMPYLSPVAHPSSPSLIGAPNDAAQLYLGHCAACHGPSGNGDGFNAAFLPVPPTRHADPVYNSTRPDDTLFDGIHSGGAILNKNHRMPPWGWTLSPTQIRSLVTHIRSLCRCQGPAWSQPMPQPHR